MLCFPHGKAIKQNTYIYIYIYTIHIYIHIYHTEARRCFIKKVLLKFLQNLQKNTLAGVFFLIKLQPRGDSGADAFLRILHNF